jgi:hypothetical protein
MRSAATILSNVRLAISCLSPQARVWTGPQFSIRSYALPKRVFLVILVSLVSWHMPSEHLSSAEAVS